MAKKKKAQLKPVARGFATTSLPSKKTIAEATAQAEEPPSSLPQPEDVGLTSQVETAQESGVGTDPRTAELQRLLDKHHERVEKDIGRTLKALETDRRVAKSYSLLEMEHQWRDKIFELAQAEENTIEVSPVTESEDRLLPRIGVLYGVLCRLGLSEDATIQCLLSIKRIELEDALEWVYLRGYEHELVWCKDSLDAVNLPPLSPRAGMSYHSASPSLRTLAISSQEPSNANSEASFPISNEVELSTVHSGRLDRESNPQGGQSRATVINVEDEGSSSGSESDPNLRYAQSRLSILRIQRSGEAKEKARRLEVLEKRVREAKNDYLFSTRLAEAEFASRRSKWEADVLKARLQSGFGPGQISTELPAAASISERPLLATTAPSAESPAEPADAPEDESMFGTLLDEMPTEEITSAGVVITVKDMASKQWSGKTPKTMLGDMVAKIDRYATISYKTISGGSRAVRSSCTIRWAGGRGDEWRMETVACHDSQQSENYAAILALHAITYPPSLGFAGGPSPYSGTSNHRTLHPVFRALWVELEEKRKGEEAEYNRNTWAKLKEVADKKLARKEADKARHQKLQDSASARERSVPSGDVTSAQAEEIMASLFIRQSTEAYQRMFNLRQTLPIAAYRQEIIETLEHHQVLVLSGETGCGKSTQLPAFIMEDQLSRGKACKIICTEPRRISAISLAQRVSAELGEPPGAVGTNHSLIGYSIRLESNITKSTRLAFVTNGIALRMLEGGNGAGATIDEVTHLIVDEVHERSIESDFLLIILKSLLEQRPNLRVVLMSATLDAVKIAEYFGQCPTIYVPGRTFPVNVGFLEDAVQFAGWRIDESSPYARRGNDKYSRGKNAQFEWSEESQESLGDEEEVQQLEPVVLEKKYSSQTVSAVNLLDQRLIPYDLIVRMLERLCFEDDTYIAYSAAILVFMPGLAEIRKLHDMLLSHELFSNEAFRIYPLHSTVSSEGQSAVFEVPPAGIRKIVISSNISETGVTIPDITAVIDSGKHRQMMFDEKRQLSRLVETFIAKSNAAQRRGRAGRVREGICFHLFTRLRHDTLMAEHPVPEMLRLSLSELALRTKIMRVDVGSSIEEILRRALDPPSQINIQRAVASLVEAGALTPGEEITGLGRYLAHMPTDVALGKFLLMATVFKCLDPALTIAATLSSKSPFVSPFGKEDEANRQKAAFRVDNSDFLTIHNAFATWRHACGNGQNFARDLCHKSFLSYQNLQQIEEIRQQYLSYLVDASLIKVDRAYEKELSRVRYSQGRGRPRFISVPPDTDVNSIPGKSAFINAAIVAGLYPKILVIDGGSSNQQMRALTNNQHAHFHPSSINFGRKPLDVSSGGHCLVYFTLMHSKKLYAWETSPVDDLAMVLLCGDTEFKLSSDAIFLDRKIRYRLDPKTLIATKRVRDYLQKHLQDRFSGQRTSGRSTLGEWEPLIMAVLGKQTEEPS
ncbi:ATP-dependent RNA helicase Dhx29; AltName: Full=DEAH box protein 29 [Serendipita indica DSM 11827]|uniref:RNA helicase n=1 Tax=Serendipita indica (strain DSM 11827) TaxID=1109443 RepID=G4T980_SERID|nr:ATP-dependent RNA helicase Dhx29; AltName: Full=DEAH box protein 29 [Serendipita indica DSM 11827]CCA67853.1 probable DNA/RNA helicase (DEAD/H box family II) [Serendipita indica DSM 11827]